MFDRSAFWSGSFAEARERAFGNSLHAAERVRIAWEMTCLASGIDPENPPPMDRSFFFMRKRES